MFYFRGIKRDVATWRGGPDSVRGRAPSWWASGGSRTGTAWGPPTARGAGIAQTDPATVVFPPFMFVEDSVKI